MPFKYSASGKLTGESVMLNIRSATTDDVDLILHFIRELAIYEKAEQEVRATADDILQTLFCKGSQVEALICEHEGEAIGFAVYFFNYSTWLGRHGLFLEDLFVTPDKRGLGAGKALFQHLARIAVDGDCGRFEWNVLDWNEPAIKFYESLGAKPQSEWIGYRLEGAALQEVATA